MDWAVIVRFADLISGLCGLLGAVILAWPAFQAVRAKRHWENLQKARRAATDPQTADALRDIAPHVEAGQLGDARGALLVNACGFALLAAAFAFLLVAAVGRALGAG